MHWFAKRPKLLLAFCFSLAVASVSAEKRPLTVADALQATRAVIANAKHIMSEEGEVEQTSRSSIVLSPDGHRYAIMLVRGDLTRNRNVVEIVTGELDSLQAATAISRLGPFYTQSYGRPPKRHDSTFLTTEVNRLIWHPDGERLFFLWEDQNGVHQIIEGNVRTRTTRFLTNHPTSVRSIAVSPSGVVFFNAEPLFYEKKSKPHLSYGFAVANRDALSLMNGQINLDPAKEFSTETFIIPRDGVPRRLMLTGGSNNRSFGGIVEFSPDGKFALVDDSPSTYPRTWIHYTEPMFRARERRFQKQLFVVDIGTMKSHPLWKAPIATREIRAWSPDGSAILVGPTFLPVTDADEHGLAGRAVAEVDVESGRFVRVPVPVDLATQGFRSLRWKDQTTIQVSLRDGRVLVFRKHSGQWRRDSLGVTALQNVQANEDYTDATVRVELRQALNEPPVLYGVELVSGREKRILSLNEQLSGLALGRVEEIVFDDEEGRTWRGLLYYPVNYVPGRRYPLVIQSGGYFKTRIEEFTLYGTRHQGLGPSYSPRAAQLLTNRGIAVVQLEDKRHVQPRDREVERHVRAFELVVGILNDRRVIDASRVGLLGFSRTGWYVEYALAHSELRYAAAVAADNWDGGYFQATIFGGSSIDFQYANNGSEPFSDGLVSWLNSAPGFNTHRIRTPLQLQLHTGPISYAIYMGWEMFARLRYLQKPVELFVIPNIEYGSHALQNPRQLFAAKQRAVDWFDFWLNGYVDPDVAKARQYAEWSILRKNYKEELRDTFEGR